jgi:hypothetical protein
MKQFTITQLLGLVFVAALCAALVAVVISQNRTIAKLEESELELNRISEAHEMLERRFSGANRAASFLSKMATSPEVNLELLEFIGGIKPERLVCGIDAKVDWDVYHYFELSEMPQMTTMRAIVYVNRADESIIDHILLDDCMVVSTVGEAPGTFLSTASNGSTKTYAFTGTAIEQIPNLKTGQPAE